MSQTSIELPERHCVRLDAGCLSVASTGSGHAPEVLSLLRHRLNFVLKKASSAARCRRYRHHCNSPAINRRCWQRRSRGLPAYGTFPAYRRDVVRELVSYRLYRRVPFIRCLRRRSRSKLFVSYVSSAYRGCRNDSRPGLPRGGGPFRSLAAEMIYAPAAPAVVPTAMADAAPSSVVPPPKTQPFSV
jgi:hypothetical protein